MKIIKTKTKDNLTFSGILTEPTDKTNKIIIHIHGMSGDIYTNSYYPEMYSEYPKNGWAFLAVEHRGTHSVTQFNAGNELKNIGNAYEIFEESVFDIEAWINKAEELGYTEIWLQSHSLGCSKVLYALNKQNFNNIKGLILLSPSDMIGLVNDPIGNKDHKILLPEAEKLVKDGKGKVILSHKLWDCMLLSAETYLNLFGPNANTAIFNYAKPELGWKEVNSINIPVIAFTGTNDDGIVPVINAFEAMTILERELNNCPKKKTIVFDGSDHDFTGFDKQVVIEVLKFIK